jgi:hypothetical protein
MIESVASRLLELVKVREGLPTTRKVARPVNTRAFLVTYLVRLPTTGLLDRNTFR